jgi:hypothetical protein
MHWVMMLPKKIGSWSNIQEHLIRKQDPISLGSWCRTQEIRSWQMTNSLGSGMTARLKGFGSALKPHPNSLGEAPFSGPSFLGLEGDAWPKLIIIIIIIIIITIVINFTLQINFIYFLVIIFIINLIILMNIIIFIILNSPDQSSYNIYNTNNIIFNINTINYNKNSYNI